MRRNRRKSIVQNIRSTTPFARNAAIAAGNSGDARFRPLLERLKYLCIACTNLDEFFEIRAATMHHAQDFGVPLPPDGLTLATVLKRIHERNAEQDAKDARER